MEFYFYDSVYQIDDKVIVTTYDKQIYVGIIINIDEHVDFYHTSPVICLTIKTDENVVEISDYEIDTISYVF